MLGLGGPWRHGVTSPHHVRVTGYTLTCFRMQIEDATHCCPGASFVLNLLAIQKVPHGLHVVQSV
jgi:hypothetical protein